MDDVAGSAHAAAETSLPAKYTEAVEAFRDANERIYAAASRLHIKRELPFVCECGRPDCTAVLHVRLEDYEAVRTSATRFLVAPGHEGGVPGAREARALGEAVVVEGAELKRDPNAAERAERATRSKRRLRIDTNGDRRHVGP